MEVKSYVLDTSALLAWIQSEAGSDKVSDYLRYTCFLSSVNLAELTTKLVDSNHVRPEMICSQLRIMGVSIVPFDEPQALATGVMRSITRTKVLSLGDRACLALAQKLSAEVVTADGAWLELDLPLSIIHIRQP